MESIIDRLRMVSLKGQLEAVRLYSEALARKFDAAPTSPEKLNIAREYDKARKQTHALQLLLDLLERKEKEWDQPATQC